MMRTQRIAGWNSVILAAVTFLCLFTLFRIYKTHRNDWISSASDVYENHHPSSDAQSHSHSVIGESDLSAHSSLNSPKVDLVVASTKAENTTWIHDRIRDWRANVYVVDDEGAEHSVALSKGKESMAYLTYIIDHYSELADIVIFTHANRFQWHNDDPDYDGLKVFRNLQLGYVQSQGYVNLRCVWVLGCPVEIRPIEDAAKIDDIHKTAVAYKKAFEELLPGTRVPEEVGQGCCAQFAVTREAMLSRSPSEYEHFRQWLINTTLDDDTSGRVFEYLWHIVFGKEPVFCPDAGDCYCKLFGLCDLKCEQGHCENRYVLPQYSSLPQDWPYVNWDGSARNFEEPVW